MDTLTRVLALCAMPVAILGCSEVKIEDVATNRAEINKLIDPNTGRVPKLEARVGDLEVWRRDTVDPALGSLSGHAAAPVAAAPPVPRGRFVRNGRYANGVWYGDWVPDGGSVSLSDRVQRTVDDARAIKEGNDKLEEIFGGKDAREKVEELRQEVERLKRERISLRARDRGRATAADAEVQRLKQEVEKLQKELQDAQKAAEAAKKGAVADAFAEQANVLQQILKELQRRPAPPAGTATPSKVDTSDFVRRKELEKYARWDELTPLLERADQAIKGLTKQFGDMGKDIERIHEQIEKLSKDSPPAPDGSAKSHADCCAAIEARLTAHLKEYEQLEQQVEDLLKRLESLPATAPPPDSALKKLTDEIGGYVGRLKEVETQLSKLESSPGGGVSTLDCAKQHRRMRDVLEGILKQFQSLRWEVKHSGNFMHWDRPGVVPPAGLIGLTPSQKKVLDALSFPEAKTLMRARTSTATGPKGTDAAYGVSRSYKHLFFQEQE